MVSAFKFVWATSSDGASSRKLKRFKGKLADSTAVVAPNLYPKSICTMGCASLPNAKVFTRHVYSSLCINYFQIAYRRFKHFQLFEAGGQWGPLENMAFSSYHFNCEFRIITHALVLWYENASIFCFDSQRSASFSLTLSGFTNTTYWRLITGF
jgi:hypothetical protein